MYRAAVQLHSNMLIKQSCEFSESSDIAPVNVMESTYYEGLLANRFSIHSPYTSGEFH